MPAIISCTQLSKAFAARPLFSGISFGINERDRIGLIGPNGAGKSTLLKILAGLDTEDSGTIARQKGLRVGLLEQVPSFPDGSTVESVIESGVDNTHDWENISRIHEYMSRLELDGSRGVKGDTKVATLSGGWKKRVALARLFAGHHDLVLLDEPTNHLDVESILWLEDFLAHANFATLVVTHDRLFLQRVSNKIWEIDRRLEGGLLTVDGDYSDYLERKELLMAGQEQREVALKNTLRREMEWLRRGPKARSTKQYARIKQAGELKQEVAELEYRNTTWKASLDFQGIDRNPKKLIEAKQISKAYNGHTLFKNADILITPKSRIGLLGNNGCGKTTLIKTLLGGVEPDSGSVTRSDQLQVVYFEQNRDLLDPKLTVAETICPKGDHVLYRGNFVHIRSYLDRFNFSQIQSGMEVSRLSGGEQSRLLIARLMLQEGNVLVLDEPTNDLDMSTLEVLEESLADFGGAVILVTHDRYFLDNVATTLIAFGEAGSANEGKLATYASLEQWERAYAQEIADRKKAGAEEKKKSPQPDSTAENSGAATGKRKLSFKEQFELDHMEETIHASESELAKLHAEVSNPSNATNAAKLSELVPQIKSLEEKIEKLYKRWAELETS